MGILSFRKPGVQFHSSQTLFVYISPVVTGGKGKEKKGDSVKFLGFEKGYLR